MKLACFLRLPSLSMALLVLTLWLSSTPNCHAQQASDPRFQDFANKLSAALAADEGKAALRTLLLSDRMIEQIVGNNSDNADETASRLQEMKALRERNLDLLMPALWRTATVRYVGPATAKISAPQAVSISYELDLKPAEEAQPDERKQPSAAASQPADTNSTAIAPPLTETEDAETGQASPPASETAQPSAHAAPSAPKADKGASKKTDPPMKLAITFWVAGDDLSIFHIARD